MVSNLDPSRFQLGSSYRFFHGQLSKLPKNKWILAVLLVVLVLLDHWFLWPVLIGAVAVGLVWLGRLVWRRGGF
jgi:hypothetical protein